MNVAAESSIHIRRLITIVVAIMERKRIRQTGKRSWGRRPTVYAKDDKPDVAFCGTVNKVFGTLESMNIGEFRSFSWSTKLEGGWKVGVETGFQCFQESSLPWVNVTSLDERLEPRGCGESNYDTY